MYILKNGSEVLVQTEKEITFVNGVWYSSEGGFTDPDLTYTLEITPDVPQSISKWQAQLILLDLNFLDTVQANVNSDPAKKIIWDGVSVFERSNGLITQIGISSMNLSDELIDKMFIAGNRYTADMATDSASRLAILQEVGLI